MYKKIIAVIFLSSVLVACENSNNNINEAPIANKDIPTYEQEHISGMKAIVDGIALEYASSLGRLDLEKIKLLTPKKEHVNYLNAFSLLKSDLNPQDLYDFQGHDIYSFFVKDFNPEIVNREKIKDLPLWHVELRDKNTGLYRTIQLGYQIGKNQVSKDFTVHIIPITNNDYNNFRFRFGGSDAITY